jgi:type IX secretion system PorP/SprF family membrane protein
MKTYKFKHLILFAGLSFSGNIMAQQDPMFTHYMFNMLAVNPGYAGSHGLLNVTGMYRNQWVGVDGAPKTQTFVAHSPFLKKNIGLGLSIINDKIGPVRQTMVFADYSYTVQVTKESKLAFGLKAGFNILKTYFSEIPLTEPNDESFTDVPISWKPNFGFGAYYYSKNYYVGISIPKILKSKIEQHLDYSKLTLQRHFFVTGGYVFNINDKFKFKPSALLQMTSGAPLSFDLNGSVLYRDLLWVGLGHRFGDSFSLLLEVQATKQLKFGYSFDLTTSRFSRYNSGTHEIMLSYDFIFKKNKIIPQHNF